MWLGCIPPEKPYFGIEPLGDVLDDIEWHGRASAQKPVPIDPLIFSNPIMGNDQRQLSTHLSFKYSPSIKRGKWLRIEYYRPAASGAMKKVKEMFRPLSACKNSLYSRQNAHWVVLFIIIRQQRSTPLMPYPQGIKFPSTINLRASQQVKANCPKQSSPPSVRPTRPRSR